MHTDKTVLVTPGEPAGIGPDICLDLGQLTADASIILIADPDLLRERADKLEKDIAIIEIDNADTSTLWKSPGSKKESLHVLPLACDAKVVCGRLDKQNSRYVLDCLDTASTLCREQQNFALVTGPVHKGIINDAGLSFTGHTEYLAAPTNDHPVMMLTTDELRVALATTHLPLSEVSQSISYDLITHVIRTVDRFFKDRLMIIEPRICVCGLNPHAGEDGHLGREEIDVIIPALEQCEEEGISVSRPLPADTAFTKDNLTRYDVVLAMYHDQGLPVLKHSGFGEAVNVTLGLPFVRTSVDHGTALDLAGTGKASASSLFKAIDYAYRIL